MEVIASQLHRLRKLVTEGKEGPLEFRKKKARIYTPREERCECASEREPCGGPVLWVFILSRRGGPMEKTSVEYASAFSGVSFQVRLVWSDWSAPGEGLISQCSWS